MSERKESMGTDINLPLTAPFETFGDFVNAFSNQQHLSSVTNDTGGLRFIFTVDGKPNQFSYLTSEFFVAAISEHVAQEILRVAKKYERYDRPDFIRKKSLWDRYMEELSAPLEGVTHLGYRG